jgi:hypothetical protein
MDLRSCLHNGKRLQSQVNHATATMRLTNSDAARIHHRAFDDEQGGFQERLLLLFGRRDRLWSRVIGTLGY